MSIIAEGQDSVYDWWISFRNADPLPAILRGWGCPQAGFHEEQLARTWFLRWACPITVPSGFVTAICEQRDFPPSPLLLPLMTVSRLGDGKDGGIIVSWFSSSGVTCRMVGCWWHFQAINSALPVKEEWLFLLGFLFVFLLLPPQPCRTKKPSALKNWGKKSSCTVSRRTLIIFLFTVEFILLCGLKQAKSLVLRFPGGW